MFHMWRKSSSPDSIFSPFIDNKDMEKEGWRGVLNSWKSYLRGVRNSQMALIREIKQQKKILSMPPLDNLTVLSPQVCI